MLKALPAHIVAGLALCLFASHTRTLAQSTPCPPPAALIAPDNPAYSDAMDLAKRLESNGFVIRCIFPTKLGSIFEVADGDVMRSTVEGEANFTTNNGAFDVIFLPKPQTFADFKISERRKAGGYLYRFTGTPRVLAGDKFMFGTAYRNYFLKQDNYLFFVSDQTLISRLEEALRSSSSH
jgi:hypothetical protein